MKKTLIRTLACIAGAAIIAALGRACNNDNTTMTNQPSYPMHVDSTELLTLYDITDCPLELACRQMPDTTQDIIFIDGDYTTNIIEMWTPEQIIETLIDRSTQLGYNSTLQVLENGTIQIINNI